MKTTIFATTMLAAVIAGCDFSEVESRAYARHRGTIRCPYCSYSHSILYVTSKRGIVKDTYIVTFKSKCPEHSKLFWVDEEYFLREKRDGTKEFGYIRYLYWYD